jgi:hypothetical protein
MDSGEKHMLPSNHRNSWRARSQQGVALITSLLILLLLLSLSLGFTLLVTSEQKSGGVDLDHSQAFYAAYGAMEQLNAAVGTVFNSNYAPTGAQLNAQASGPTDINGSVAPPVIPGVTFYDPINGLSGYEVSFPHDGSGNPTATPGLITQGQYQGFQGLITDYTITINAQTQNYSLTTGTSGVAGTNRYGSEVRLRRSLQTVAIPVFQFGIFSQTDLSFFPGPSFNFGGVVATNGNLYLATGNTLTLAAQTSAYGDVIRDQLSNGYNGSAYQGSYAGNVSITTSPGTGTYRNLAYTEGSINGGPSGGCPLGTGAGTPNTNWTTISISDYNSNLRNGAFGCSRGTGAKNLQLPLVSSGATGIDLIKLPPTSEDTLNPSVYAQRYFTYPTGTTYAMVRVIITDTLGDITSLPSVTATAPVSMTAGLSTVALGTETGKATYLPPWAKSQGGTANCTQGNLATNCGDWFASGWSRLGMGDSTTTNCTPNPTAPTSCGPYIKIEYQDSGTSGWTDVTTQILQLGYVGRNITNGTGAVNAMGLTAANLAGNNTTGLSGTGAVGCFEPHPNAVIRLQRVRDVPSNYSASNKCGYPSGSTSPFPTSGGGATGVLASGFSTDGRDYIPMVVFDTREGVMRDCWGGTGDCSSTATAPSLAGVMDYVEIDVNNLARWFKGSIGSKGAAPSGTAGYLLYISDRRGNQVDSQNGSPEVGVNCNGASKCKLGNLGWEDFVNPASTNGAPNNTMDTGEDLHGGNETVPGQPAVSLPLEIYGGKPAYQPSTSSPYPLSNASPANGNMANGASAAGNNSIRPGTGNTSAGTGTTLLTTVTTNEARVNPPLFFRRAVKLTDAQTISLGNCPGTTNPCGLTITAENPIYVEGNYNATGGSFAGADTPSAILADAVTFLSVNWNDLSSFNSPYSDSGRAAVTSYYRMAILAGKGISFPKPTTGSVNYDFGTDGGVHNFLRYIENWSNQTLNYSGSLVSFFFNEQAVGTYKDGASAVYDPPSRGYNFDTNFLTPTLLPPRTPTFRDINTLGFTQLIMPNQQ